MSTPAVSTTSPNSVTPKISETVQSSSNSLAMRIFKSVLVGSGVGAGFQYLTGNTEPKELLKGAVIGGTALCITAVLTKPKTSPQKVEQKTTTNHAAAEEKNGGEREEVNNTTETNTLADSAKKED